MGYDEGLAERIRDVLAGTPGLTEKKMFGGIAFMIGGNMAVGVMKAGDLMVRLDPESWEKARTGEGASDFVHGGRAMKGFLLVKPASVADDAALRTWVTRGADFAKSLPIKKK
jgi:hypothetical protein